MQDLTNVQFLSPLNLIQCWNEFSAEWKKVRREFSETPVHDLRVATRRMISELEIASVIDGDRKSRTIIHKFKRLLKRLGLLRDIQVHLLRAGIGKSSGTRRFFKFLQEQEKKEVRRLRNRMQQKTKRDLRRGAWNTNQKLHATLKGISRPLLLKAIEESLQKRSDAVMSAYASFRRSSSTEDFHRMRIKFKRFRYAAEVTEQVLGVPTKKQIARMKNMQKIMGEIHDLQAYMAAIVEWSGSKVPVHLQREYDALMKAFNDRPGPFEEFVIRSRSKERSARA